MQMQSALARTSSGLRAAAAPGGLRLARGLGWFSIALGAVELMAARPLARMLGLRGSENTLRLFGLREVGTGLAIINAPDPTPWIWTRVAGDALDIGTVLGGVRRRPEGVMLGLVALLGATVLDLVCVRQLSRD